MVHAILRILIEKASVHHLSRRAVTLSHIIWFSLIQYVSGYPVTARCIIHNLNLLIISILSTFLASLTRTSIDFQSFDIRYFILILPILGGFFIYLPLWVINPFIKIKNRTDYVIFFNVRPCKLRSIPVNTSDFSDHSCLHYSNSLSYQGNEKEVIQTPLLIRT